MHSMKNRLQTENRENPYCIQCIEDCELYELKNYPKIFKIKTFVFQNPLVIHNRSDTY